MRQPPTPIPPDGPDDFLDDLVAYLLARASHLVGRRYFQVLKGRGLPLSRWRVLSALWSGRGRTVGEIADVCLCEQPTASRLIERMVREGLVRRTSSPDDRRKALVRITAKGRRRAAPSVKANAADERTVLADLDPQKAAALKAALRTLIAQIVADEDEARSGHGPDT